MTGASIRFSRNGTTSPFGKLDSWLERQRIESEIKEKLALRAASIGKPSAEVMRDVARIVALGADEAEKVYGRGVLKVVRLIVGMSDEPSDT